MKNEIYKIQELKPIKNKWENIEYEFFYENENGDKFSSDIYSSKADCLSEMRTLEITGYIITRTFKYVDNVYKGRFI
tara:strand:- start:6837 stop:7067 length:231 start_codon:yes stop_codon:yes gene_type:complete